MCSIQTSYFKQAELINDEIIALNKIEDENTIMEKLKEPDEKNQDTADSSETPLIVTQDGSLLKFISRIELEHEIMIRENEVQIAATSKRFKEATQIQEIIDKLQDLRIHLFPPRECSRANVCHTTVRH